MPRPEDSEEMGLKVRNAEVKAKWKKVRNECAIHRIEEIGKLVDHAVHLAGEEGLEVDVLKEIMEACRQYINDRVVAKMPRPLM